MKDKRICVIGLGYIGLPTAALIAHNGYEVYGVDINQEVINTVNQGRIHIVEPDLEAYVFSSVASKKLQAFTHPKVSDIYIICVPTPFLRNPGLLIPQPNLEYVHSAAKSIAPLLKAGDSIILESTCPVGTTESIKKLFLDEGIDVSQIRIAYCPERVLPGRIMIELVENDRIVGGLKKEDAKFIGDFYRTFVRGRVFETTASIAEMCKLAENSYRDVNIAFANELSMLCARSKINVWEVIELANRHPRVNILQPGVGVGGHCIAVDPWFIVSQDPEYSRLIKCARLVNDDKTSWVVNQIEYAIQHKFFGNTTAVKIACLGISFKPNVDDLRESPAIEIVDHLQANGHQVMVVEPNIKLHEKFNLVELKKAIEECDVIVGLVAHKEFENVFSDFSDEEKIYLNFCSPSKFI